MTFSKATNPHPAAPSTAQGWTPLWAMCSSKNKEQQERKYPVQPCLVVHHQKQVSPTQTKTRCWPPARKKQHLQDSGPSALQPRSGSLLLWAWPSTVGGERGVQHAASRAGKLCPCHQRRQHICNLLIFPFSTRQNKALKTLAPCARTCISSLSIERMMNLSAFHNSSRAREQTQTLAHAYTHCPISCSHVQTDA